jgi:hypothetical protein
MARATPSTRVGALARVAARACAKTACVGAGAGLGAIAGAVLGARARRGALAGAARGALAGARALLETLDDARDAHYRVFTDERGRLRVVETSIPRAMRFGDVVRAMLELESTYEALEAGAGAETRGASANVLARLPRREYRGTTMTTRVCAVCLETFVDGEVVKRASSTCSHEFHDACIDAWLARRDCCPMCRTRAEAPTGRVEFEID